MSLFKHFFSSNNNKTKTNITLWTHVTKQQITMLQFYQNFPRKTKCCCWPPTPSTTTTTFLSDNDWYLPSKISRPTKHNPTKHNLPNTLPTLLHQKLKPQFFQKNQLQLMSKSPSFIQSTKPFFKKITQKINSPSKILLLSLFAIGVLLFAFSVWITYYDLTFWNKNLMLTLLWSRNGETISLGIGMKLIYYFKVNIILIAVSILFFFLPKDSQIINQIQSRSG